MTITKAGKILYVLAAFSLVFPWFSYNARMMGYCWGFEFIPLFFAPMTMTGVYVFGNHKSRTRFALGISGSLFNIAALVYALGTWHEMHNITGGFQLIPGIRTATIGFWFTGAVFIILLAVTVFSGWNRTACGSANEEGESV